MKSLREIIVKNFTRYAFVIGLVPSIICMGASYAMQPDSRLGSLLINLAGDFIMVGVTISLVDRLIYKSERTRYGTMPRSAKDSINRRIWSIVLVASFMLHDALADSPKLNAQREMPSDEDEALREMRENSLSNLKSLDASKTNLSMFSNVLGYLKTSLTDIDGLIARYGPVLDAEDISDALAIRDKIELIGNEDMLLTVTIPFRSEQTPQQPLTIHEQAALEHIINQVTSLPDHLLKQT